jgi:hypothetical protein
VNIDNLLESDVSGIDGDLHNPAIAKPSTNATI